MLRHEIILSILAAILLTTLHFESRAQNNKRKVEPVIRQVGDILVQASNPRFLFDFFTDTLQLPVAWPIADNSGFTSAAIGAGNVSIEIFRVAGQKDSSTTGRPSAHFMGLAFEPYPLTASLPELQTRGIRCNALEPYVSTLPNGSKGTLWTTVVLPEFSRPDLSIFLREYNPAFLHAEIRRKQFAGRLALNKGGPLGFEFVKEVVIGTTDLESDRSQWQKLLMPVKPSSTDTWQAGGGPAIHLVWDTKDRIQRIVLKVQSLLHAKTFLAEKHLLGAVLAKEIAVNPSRIQGLGIRLVEK